MDVLDLECKQCHGRLGVAGGVVRCDECGVPDASHPLTQAKAPPPRDLPEPKAIESEATLAGRVLDLERRLSMLETREASRRKGA